MQLDEYTLFDLQVCLGDLQRRLKTSDDRPAAEAVMYFEGEELKEVLRKLWCAEQQLRRYEIQRVNESSRRRR